MLHSYLLCCKSLIAKAARSARGQIRGSSFQTANNGPTGTRQVQPTHDNPLIYSIRVTSHLCQRQLRQITDICFTHICSVEHKLARFPPCFMASAPRHRGRGIVARSFRFPASFTPQTAWNRFHRISYIPRTLTSPTRFACAVSLPTLKMEPTYELEEGARAVLDSL